tara:strand:- start:2458 stop:3357 length:900 start_codon:yes stop_codon:yes gene_type:complete
MSKKTKKSGFLNGLTIKPQIIAPSGQVFFTDGTNNGLVGNQTICEQYGFTYNKKIGACMAFNYNTELTKTFSNQSVKQTGTRNTIREKVQNTIITGTQNVIKGYNSNISVLGSEHTVDRDFNNSNILGGSRGTVSRQSEIVLGGGKRAISDSTNAVTFNSRRKTSTLELSCVTIDNTATNMTIQGDGESFINVENNSIIGYDIYITRLELGGTSGTAGNYSYRNIRGAVKINQVGVMSFVVGFSRNIAKVGVNGTCIMADSTTGGVPSISVNVQDRNNVHNLWSASVTLHEVISETNIV